MGSLLIPCTLLVLLPKRSDYTMCLVIMPRDSHLSEVIDKLREELHKMNSFGWSPEFVIGNHSFILAIQDYRQSGGFEYDKKLVSEMTPMEAEHTQKMDVPFALLDDGSDTSADFAFCIVPGKMEI